MRDWRDTLYVLAGRVQNGLYLGAILVVIVVGLFEAALDAQECMGYTAASPWYPEKCR